MAQFELFSILFSTSQCSVLFIKCNQQKNICIAKNRHRLWICCCAWVVFFLFWSCRLNNWPHTKKCHQLWLCQSTWNSQSGLQSWVIEVYTEIEEKCCPFFIIHWIFSLTRFWSPLILSVCIPCSVAVSRSLSLFMFQSKQNEMNFRREHIHT